MTSVPRWAGYLLEWDEALASSWTALLSEPKRLRVILGSGFDPRMCIGLEMLLGVNTEAHVSVLVLDYDEGIASPSRAHDAQAGANMKRLEDLCSVAGATLEYAQIEMWSEDGRRISGRSAARAVTQATIDGFSDIVIDVSALPRGIYLPLLAKMIHLVDKAEAANLSVFVAESPDLDFSITEEGLAETAEYLHPFAATLDLQSVASQPKVWLPVLGEEKRPHLARIHELVQPDEICPVLPSPSRNPRRSDNIVLEYRELLFDELQVEESNFVLAAEDNPFDVYRQIRAAAIRYQEALEPIGGSRTVISAMSSKLMSLGVLLAAYELRFGLDMAVGIAQVESTGHKMNPMGAETVNVESRLFGAAICGECYG